MVRLGHPYLLLNYVPYIGSLIATIPPILFGFVTLGTVAVDCYDDIIIGKSTSLGECYRNERAGRALDLSPVLLLIVTAFSFWLRGIVGMILSVPFVVIIKIVLENIEATRPIAILLSERAPYARRSMGGGSQRRWGDLLWEKITS